MIRCFNCGTENEDGLKYCSNCGAMLNVPMIDDEDRETIATPADDEEPIEAPGIDAPVVTASPVVQQNSSSTSNKSKSKTDNMCLAGMIVSLCSFITCGFAAPVGLVLSILGFNSAKKNGKQGTTLAVIGMVASGLGLLMLLFFLLPSRGSSGTVSKDNDDEPTTTITETEATPQNKIGLSSEEVKTMNYEDVEAAFRSAGFTGIELVANNDISGESDLEEGIVAEVTVNGESSFNAKDAFPIDAHIVIKYHSIATIPVGSSSLEFRNINYNDAVTRLELAGFTNIEVVPNPDLIVGVLHDDGDVDTVTINGQTQYDASTQFPADAVVRVTYHTYPSGSQTTQATTASSGSAGAETSETTSAGPDLSVNAFGQTIEYDGFELTFGESASFTTIDNFLSSHDGETAVVIPVHIKNAGTSTKHFSPFSYTLFGSHGTEVDDESIYFDNGLYDVGEIRPGGEGDYAYYFYYDGDGTYFISFSGFLRDTEVGFPIVR